MLWGYAVMTDQVLSGASNSPILFSTASRQSADWWVTRRILSGPTRTRFGSHQHLPVSSTTCSRSSLSGTTWNTGFRLGLVFLGGWAINVIFLFSSDFRLQPFPDPVDIRSLNRCQLPKCSPVGWGQATILVVILQSLGVRRHKRTAPPPLFSGAIYPVEVD